MEATDFTVLCILFYNPTIRWAYSMTTPASLFLTNHLFKLNGVKLSGVFSGIHERPNMEIPQNSILIHIYNIMF